MPVFVLYVEGYVMISESSTITQCLPHRLRETLKADLRARDEYPEATAKDVARDMNCTDRTIRNRRAAMRRMGIAIPPMRGPGRPRKVA
jgi:hypothetical protein